MACSDRMPDTDIVAELAKHPGGRPSEYDPTFIAKVDAYLATREDQEVDTGEKTSRGEIVYGTKIKVRLNQRCGCQ